jgi:hypothetical protein
MRQQFLVALLVGDPDGADIVFALRYCEGLAEMVYVHGRRAFERPSAHLVAETDGQRMIRGLISQDQQETQGGCELLHYSYTGTGPRYKRLRIIWGKHLSRPGFHRDHGDR